MWVTRSGSDAIVTYLKICLLLQYIFRFNSTDSKVAANDACDADATSNGEHDKTSDAEATSPDAGDAETAEATKPDCPPVSAEGDAAELLDEVDDDVLAEELGVDDENGAGIADDYDGDDEAVNGNEEEVSNGADEDAETEAPNDDDEEDPLQLPDPSAIDIDSDEEIVVQPANRSVRKRKAILDDDDDDETKDDVDDDENVSGERADEVDQFADDDDDDGAEATEKVEEKIAVLSPHTVDAAEEIDCPSSEDEIKMAKKMGKNLFVEDEAQLSDEDAFNDSGDEDEDALDQQGIDELMKMIDTDFTMTDAEVRRQIEGLHMKKEMAQDKRALRLLKERLLGDSDLYDDEKNAWARTRNLLTWDRVLDGMLDDEAEKRADDPNCIADEDDVSEGEAECKMLREKREREDAVRHASRHMRKSPSDTPDDEFKVNLPAKRLVRRRIQSSISLCGSTIHAGNLASPPAGVKRGLSAWASTSDVSGGVTSAGIVRRTSIAVGSFMTPDKATRRSSWLSRKEQSLKRVASTRLEDDIDQRAGLFQFQSPTAKQGAPSCGADRGPTTAARVTPPKKRRSSAFTTPIASRLAHSGTAAAPTRDLTRRSSMLDFIRSP